MSALQIRAKLIPYKLVDGRCVTATEQHTQLALEYDRGLLIEGLLSALPTRGTVVGKLSEAQAEMCKSQQLFHPPIDELKVLPLTAEDCEYALLRTLQVHDSCTPGLAQYSDISTGKDVTDITAVAELNPAQAAVKQIFDEAMSKIFSSTPSYTTRDYVDAIIDRVRGHHNSGEI